MDILIGEVEYTIFFKVYQKMSLGEDLFWIKMFEIPELTDQNQIYNRTVCICSIKSCFKSSVEALFSLNKSKTSCRFWETMLM